ncbi:KTSC domain-containing protein [Klebsiella aerogenes]|uniref:KTSC domain-containing protein n=1 Tax=Klebsiella aerogenes TaxID=548 RepID=UPI001F29BCA2|nr:KTSC domain-containing protein [Klebsiella aerogenes]
MIRQPVSSSNLRSVGYDASMSVLEIEFHNGGIYQYLRVDVSVYNGLMRASPKGAFYDMYIKKAGYQYIKVC